MYKYLLDIFKEKETNVNEVAEKLGISKVSLYKKINGKVKISLIEAQKIALLLSMTLDALFPAEIVSKNETKQVSINT